MRITALTDPSSPDRANEDALQIGPDLAVVVDGAGLPASMRRGCSHSVAWFSRTLARLLAAALSREGSEALGMADALAEAIAAVRDLHAGTCDLAAGSPSGTVAAWRVREGVLETLVLCDAAIVLAAPDAGAELITDLRVHGAVSRFAEVLEREDPDDAAGTGIPLRFRALDAARNAEGGFWCAHHDPEAAHHALVRTVPWTPGTVVAAASDGAIRAILEVGTHTAERFAEQCRRGELEMLCDEVRAAERDRAASGAQRGMKIHDDLTIVVGRP